MRSTEPSPLMRYMRARAADAAGLPELAAAQYAAVLAANPGDLTLATRAYRQAVIAGDRVLALKSARLLDQAGALPPDGRLLLLSEEFVAGNWSAARLTVDRIEREQAFGFAVPVIRAWIAHGANDGDALSLLSRPGASVISNAYSAEHRILLMLAQGKSSEAMVVVRANASGAGMRDLRLRILTAQALAASGDNDGAQALLTGEDPALRIARARLDQDKRAPSRIDAPFGLSELLVRIAADLNHERVTPLSPALARIATFAAPRNVEAWLGTGQLLAANDQLDAALAAIAQVPADDPFAPAARSIRLRILMRQGEKEQALAINQLIVQSPGVAVEDWVLQGDILSGMERPTEAADAYARAIGMIDPARRDDERLWSLWLMRGNALEQGDKWPEAKAALETALDLAPDQAVVLNYLGYAQLERRENVIAARALIEKASLLRPDDAAITDSLGWAHYLAGDYATAISKLEAAAEGDPGGSEINEHLGDAYWSAGRKIEARFAWRAALVNAQSDAVARITRKVDYGLDGGDPTP